jgi:valyl-tRNA synthetase
MLQRVDGALSYHVIQNEYFIPITGNINVEEEIAKLTTRVRIQKGFLKSKINYRMKNLSMELQRKC